MRNLRKIIAAFLASIFLSIAALAQEPNRSEIRIVLTDQIGNIIVDAEILLVTKDGLQKKARTNNDGVAKFPGLAAGQYTIAAEISGFKSYKGDPISLR